MKTQGALTRDRSGVNANFLVVGLVRNCAKVLESDIVRLEAALARMQSVYWLLIESDSTDETIDILSDISKTKDNFEFISLGTLRERLPLRSDRVAHCRNAYLAEIESNPLYRDIEYVIVSDFDGLNTTITEKAIFSCWQRDDWDVCTANQSGPYYDIWALRHKDWCPNDCFAHYRFLARYDTNEEDIMYASVYSKMITIPYESEWIEVDSAFGGLAVYRREVFAGARYRGLTDRNEEVCEHVSFHDQLKQKGYRIFINPQLINAAHTPQTDHFRMTRRLVRSLKRTLKMPVQLLIGRRRFARLMGFLGRRRD
jgi:hypothetical protein